MASSETRGARALLVFSVLALANGVRLCTERAADLYGLRDLAVLTPDQLVEARPYQRVRVDGALLRPKDVLFRRTDLPSQPFYERDPTQTVTVKGPTELAALVAGRKALHGVHVELEATVAVQPFLLDADTREVKGAAFVDLAFAPLAGTDDALWVAGPVGADRRAGQAALQGKSRFSGTLVMLRELDRFDELYQSLRAAGRKDPYDVRPFVVLDGEPPPAPSAVQRLVPLGPGNNLFVAVARDVDVAALPSFPLEGTLAAPIEDPIPRNSLRRLSLIVREQTELHRPLRVVVLGPVSEFRASPGAPWVVHPGGAFMLLLGVLGSFLGLRWGALHDRSEVEHKLRLDFVVGVIELLVVLVPVVWFVVRTREVPVAAPLPTVGTAPPLASSAVPSASAPVGAASGSAGVEAVLDGIGAVQKATSAQALGSASAVVAGHCASIGTTAAGQATCRRAAPLAVLEVAVRLLGKAPAPAERRRLCLAADAAARALAEAHEADDVTVRDLLVAVGRACR